MRCELQHFVIRIEKFKILETSCFMCDFYNIVTIVRVKRGDYRSRIEYRPLLCSCIFRARVLQPHRIRSIQKTVDRGSRCIHSSRIPGQAEKPGGAQSPITRV